MSRRSTAALYRRQPKNIRSGRPPGSLRRRRTLIVLPHLDTPPARTLSQSSVQENPGAQDSGLPIDRPGVWSLTAKAKNVSQVDPHEVVRFVRAQDKKASESKPDRPDLADDISEDEAWKRKLHAILTQKLSPAAFERLVQRVLRESGFMQVEVTGRSGDGGIDGRGISRIHGFMSLHVVIQCKRYKGSVSAGEVRDFRGAMVGRADKGLFISTGTFTPAAVKEATRDGAPPIDLVYGGELAEKLRELGLGVRKETVEVARVDEQWFDNV